MFRPIKVINCPAVERQQWVKKPSSVYFTFKSSKTHINKTEHLSVIYKLATLGYFPEILM